MNRYRSCSNPPVRYGGQFCAGADSEMQACGLSSCPIDGNWSDWLEWSSCSKTCGSNGKRTRRRVCDNPEPKFDGRACPGDATQSDSCALSACEGKQLSVSL